jgi:tetratricopeptide (TPR) repeat protein
LRSPIRNITFNTFSTATTQSKGEFKSAHISKRLEGFLKEGKVRIDSGNFKDADSYYLSAEEASKLVSDVNSLTLSQFYLGYSNLRLEHYAKASSYFQKALPGLKEQNNNRFYVLSLAYAAESEAKQSKFDEAIDFSKQALNEVSKLKDEPLIVATIKVNLASYLASKEMYAEAIPLSEQGLETYSQVLGRHDEATKQVGLNLAKLYQDSGMSTNYENLIMQEMKRNTRN